MFYTWKDWTSNLWSRFKVNAVAILVVRRYLSLSEVKFGGKQVRPKYIPSLKVGISVM